MTRTAIGLAFLLTLTGVVGAQDTAVTLREVAPAEARVTKRLFFVVDVSGSMKASMPRMVASVGMILNQPLDEYDVAIVAFSSEASRWPGFREQGDTDPPPEGWAKFPSLNAMTVATAWLSMFTGQGSTNPVGALETALKDRRDELTIVFVTDGRFDGGPAAAHAKIDECQKWREQNGLGRAVVVALGIAVSDSDMEHMTRIGREGGGGFYVEERAPEPTPQAVQPQSTQPAPGPGVAPPTPVQGQQIGPSIRVR